MNEGRQKGMILMVSEAFLAEIDKAYPSLGYSDRASFVRAAVHEYLSQNNIKLPMSFRAAPPRTGKSKGGRPKKISSRQIEDLKVSAKPKKTKLKPVPGTGNSDENTKAG
jgi:hypothetical protein